MCLCICMPSVWWCPWRPEKTVQSPEVCSTYVCETPDKVVGIKLGVFNMCLLIFQIMQLETLSMGI